MHPWMLVETTRVTEFEYYFASTRKDVHPKNVYRGFAAYTFFGSSIEELHHR